MGVGASNRSWRSRLLTVAVLLLAAGSAVSCARSVTEDQFEEIIAERGNVLSQESVREAVARVEEAQDGERLSLRQIRITRRSVAIVVVDESSPGGFVGLSFSQGELDPPVDLQEGSPGFFARMNVTVPVQERVEPLPPGDRSFAPSDIALDQLDDLLDQAVATAKIPNGAAASVRIEAAPGQPPTIIITVEATDDDAEATVTFDASGQLLGGP